MTNQTSNIKDSDVLLGRGKVSFHHVGNKWFRKVTTKYSTEYAKAENRPRKNAIVSHIMAMVEQDGGRFLRMEGDLWIDVDSKYVKEKVAHALRDVYNRSQAVEALKHSSPARPSTSTTLIGSRPSSRCSLLEDETCEKWEKVNCLKPFLKLPSIQQASLLEALCQTVSSSVLDRFNEIPLSQLSGENYDDDDDNDVFFMLRKSSSYAVEPIRHWDEPNLENLTTIDWLTTMSCLAA